MVEAIFIFTFLALSLAVWLWRRPTEPTVASVCAIPSDEKIDKHVRRFTLALEQCEKGEDRKAELKRNLDYWLAVKAAAELKRGNG